MTHHAPMVPLSITTATDQLAATWGTLATTEGRASMLQDGGYPYLFHASGAEIKTNFATAGVEAISALCDATWYLVEAWDQS